MDRILKLITCFLVILIAPACKQDTAPVSDDFDLVVRIDRDIGRISPILSHTSRAREVYPYVFLNLADYDPKTLKLSPVLAETMPTKSILEDGRIKYSFRILDDAVWSNGNSITAKDFLFTLKLIYHPNIVCPSWKSGLSIIDDVILDSGDTQKIDFILQKEEINNLEMLCSFEVYPEHLYDPSGVMSNISFEEIKNENFTIDLISKDSTFSKLASDFSSSKYGMDIVEGAGAYKIKEWETDQYIRLERKENWWGAKYPERTNLIANPKEIIFQIIADETTALTQLKGGTIDLMKVKNGPAFKNLQSEFEGKLGFHKPRIQQYFYLAVNNQDEIMKYREVRKALAMSIDIEKIIEVMESGDAVPIAGTVEPFVDSYNSVLSHIEQNTEAASNLLEESGWSDADNDGIYDRTINGKFTELELQMFASSANSEKLALLVKESAKNVGIEINITRKKLSLIRSDHIYKGDYQMFPMVSSWDLSPYDPYSRWHSDNIKTNGNNINFYTNDEIDKIILEIKSEVDPDSRNKLYAELDKIMYDDQPVIFLYSPLDRIVTSKRIDPLIANKRPGYFANAFKLKKVQTFSDN